MSNFESLERVLTMDFTQMRALPSVSSDSMRATDAAIEYFVNELFSFYNQFDARPTSSELNQYLDYMKQITAKINESEFAYYLTKYTATEGSFVEAQQMAKLTQLKTFHKIPDRMQYWAASGEFGGTIRNASKHKQVVDAFYQWMKWIESPYTPVLFQPQTSPSLHTNTSLPADDVVAPTPSC